MPLTIGVLGGMGPEASADFYRRIVDLTFARRDQDHLHVIVDGDPSVPDRTAFLDGKGDDPVPALRTVARRLEIAGAELIVMACNTAHAFYPQVAQSMDVPLVDWIGEAAGAMAGLYGSQSRIAVLATKGTLKTQLYQTALDRHGVEACVPDGPAQQELMDVIYGKGGVKAGGNDRENLRRRVQGVAEQSIASGADAVLLACTELSSLFYAVPKSWPVPVEDAAQLVAGRVIELAGGTVRTAC